MNFCSLDKINRNLNIMFKIFLIAIALILSGCHQKELANQRKVIDQLNIKVARLEKGLQNSNEAATSGNGRDGQLHKEVARLRNELYECKKMVNKIEEPENMRGSILPVTLLHKDELGESYQELNWLGLCRKAGGYSLEKVEVDFTNVHDPLIDSSTEETGWLPKISGEPDSCFYLFAGIDIINRGVVDFVDLEKKVILPGDTLQFNFVGKNYLLYATGHNPGGEWYGVSDYKLYLRSDFKNTPQALVYEYQFDDDIIDILWAGDIDGDHILDLIIDTSNHYNVMEISLFLSSYSAGQKIVEKVAVHRKVGC